MEFAGKTAVVTGGTGGIGKAVAAKLGHGGASVVLSDLIPEAGDVCVRDLQEEGIRASFVQTDVTDVSRIRRLFSETVAQHSKIDIFVHCPGISRLTKVPDISEDEWDLVMAVNLKSVFFCAQEALRHMCVRKSGKIVTLSSASGKIGGVAVGAHYAASKAGVICLTKSLALYAAPFHVNVNSVCPGPTRTRMTDEWGEEINAAFAKKIPFQRYAEPEEIADAVCFLASDRASYITGEIVDVNGGLVLD